jgi:hypothetical protein
LYSAGWVVGSQRHVGVLDLLGDLDEIRGLARRVGRLDADHRPRNATCGPCGIASSGSSVDAKRSASVTVSTTATPSTAAAASVRLSVTVPLAIVAWIGAQYSSRSTGASWALGAVPVIFTQPL